MKNIFIILFLFSPVGFFDTDYKIVRNRFRWVKRDFYEHLQKRCKLYDIDIFFALSIAQVESGGKNVVSKKNRNGTMDYGIFQVNSVHGIHRGYKKNIDIAMWYLRKCLKKSRGNKKIACIYYNCGLNCNLKSYKKDYPRRVMDVYKNR